jgi:hypothetical protein
MSDIVYERGKKEFEDAYEIAEAALRRKKAARNSDEFFCWYCRKYLMPRNYMESSDLNNFSEFKGEVSIRSLIRKKAEIQNDEGRFPPSDPEIAKKKSVKADVIRRYYSDQETLDKFREFGYPGFDESR